MSSDTDPFVGHVVLDMRERTQGARSPLSFGGGKRCTFQMGVPKSYAVDEGFFMITGEIVTASGHRFHALLEISALDSGEHFGTGVAYVDAHGQQQLAFQGEDDFKSFVATMQAMDPAFKAFPYAYRYYVSVCRDIHVDEATGWSNTWESLQKVSATLDTRAP